MRTIERDTPILDAQARARAQWPHCGAHDNDKQVAEDLIIAFDHGRKRVSDGEQATLQRWVSTWLEEHPDAMVAMGCRSGTREHVRSARVERLRGLRDALVSAGVSADQIRYTGDHLAPPPRAGATGESVIWMQALRPSALDAGLAPIRSLFNRPSGGRRASATRAS